MFLIMGFAKSIAFRFVQFAGPHRWSAGDEREAPAVFHRPRRCSVESFSGETLFDDSGTRKKSLRVVAEAPNKKHHDTCGMRFFLGNALRFHTTRARSAIQCESPY